MPSPPSNEMSAIGHLCYTITNLCLGGVVFGCCIFGHNIIFGSDSFKQHIILCVLGYVLIMPQAMMMFSESSGWSRILGHKNKKIVHLLLQLAACALVTAGSVIRIQGYPGETFGTNHGILGLAALVLSGVNALGGLVSFFLNRPNKFIGICHAVIGCIALILAFACLCIALGYSSFQSYAGSNGSSTMIGATVVGLIGSLFIACSNVYKKVG